ncbi:WD40-repeat-containing domain protein [Gymnopilus junonius]|uniref:WD40-repeat-containing domain protein n=1 Tax=Gymnopilus junonius TaxID=109634 RepID=A0A9P5NKW3_GYMJU|nr:WD40-repeat-containing domain protein [Gymnopilus junonius]
MIPLPFSPNVSRLVQLHSDKFRNKWPRQLSLLAGHTNSVCSVTFSPNGKHIVSGSQDMTIRIWDAQTGQLIGEPLEGHGHWIESIVSGSWDMTIRIWDAETGQMIGELLAGHTKSAESVVFSLDGRQIVSGSGDKTIRIWDVEVKLNSFMQTTNLVRNYFFGTKISLQTNGWVYGPNNELLLWIPPFYHLGLHLPQTLKVIGAHETVLDFSSVVWGSHWAACYTPTQAKKDRHIAGVT